MLTKQEIRQLGTKEMIDELQKSRRELLKSQFDIRGGSSKEVHVVKNLRRYIARLQTITKEMNKTDKAAAQGEETKASETTPATAKKTSAPKKPAPAKAAKAKTPAKKPAAAKSAKK